jgi:hypothetical protein
MCMIKRFTVHSFIRCFFGVDLFWRETSEI